MLAIPLDAEIEHSLEALGATTASSKQQLARERLLAALQEDLEDLRTAQERLAQPARRWTQEELERELDLER